MPNKAYDPIEGMTDLELLLAGIGRGMYHTGLGVGQTLGLVDENDIRNQRKLDGPLMASSMGSTGSAVGRTAALVPTAFVPGANTLAGAGLLGVATGAAAPSASDTEAWQNIIGGGLLGPMSIGAGRAAQGLLSAKPVLKRLAM